MTGWPEPARIPRAADERGVEHCRYPSCGGRIRWATTVNDQPMPINADPDPAGNLVWTRIEGRGWRMRVLHKGETPQPPDDLTRRWKPHKATCTPPQARGKPSAAERPSEKAARLAAERGFQLLVNADLEPEEIPPPRRARLQVVREEQPVTRTPLPPLEQLGADQDVGQRTCEGCGAVSPVALPHLDGTGLVMLDRTAGLYGLLAVQLDGRWLVRDTGPLDRGPGLPLTHRVRRHQCPDLAYHCITPGHADRPAGRIATGATFCADCLQRRKETHG